MDDEADKLEQLVATLGKENELATLLQAWMSSGTGSGLEGFCSFLGSQGKALGDVADEDEALQLMEIWYSEPEYGFEALEGLSSWP